MSRAVKRKSLAQLRRDNRKWPTALRKIPRDEWPPLRLGIRPAIELWRSSRFAVQIFEEEGGFERMSVNRTSVEGNRWRDGITWDELQSLKRECNRGRRAAVEIFPPDDSLVDVANIRHLWVYPEGEAPDFMWCGS